MRRQLPGIPGLDARPAEPTILRGIHAEARVFVIVPRAAIKQLRGFAFGRAQRGVRYLFARKSISSQGRRPLLPMIFADTLADYGSRAPASP